MFESDIRCNCTMLKVGDRWAKPGSGYLDPDPDCPKCGGMGSKPTKIMMGDGAKVWCGVCPICGESNGVHFDYPDFYIGLPDGDDRAPCLNKECPNEFCSWVREEIEGERGA